MGTEISDKHTKLTGRAGALYLFDNGIAPYISYSESFNPNSYWTVRVIPGHQPLGTDNLYTASLFRIDQENLASKLSQENFYHAVGAFRSQGLELEAHMQLTGNLKVLRSGLTTSSTAWHSMVCDWVAVCDMSAIAGPVRKTA